MFWLVIVACEIHIIIWELSFKGNSGSMLVKEYL